ncbi:SpdD protein [Streptomyces sp. NBC_00659]|uniref:SpdD protein n=1 Tax=Streptomyces sp. NBC_00659 TaxID=2903669 RepID=UPI002E33BB89|nr:SpdD protein [Streptomyces sp. NBC_00659]
MFKPKYPPMETAPVPAAPRSTVHSPVPLQHAAPAPTEVASNRSAVQLTPGSALTLVVGGSAVVLVMGAVLVSMLLAVAITAASVAVCAVTVRSILKSDRR